MFCLAAAEWLSTGCPPLTSQSASPGDGLACLRTSSSKGYIGAAVARGGTQQRLLAKVGWERPAHADGDGSHVVGSGTHPDHRC